MMTIAQTTVVGQWLTADLRPGTGKVVIAPASTVVGSDTIITGPPVTVQLTNGGISIPLASADGVPGLQYLVTEQITGWPSVSYVITPTGATLDLATAPRGVPGPVIPLYVLASRVGQPEGPAGPLDANQHLPASQIPASALELWRFAESYAGLSNPSAIVPYPSNDPNNAITLPAGTYQNYLFICSELIIPNNATKLFNCDIVTTNANFGIRLDANTGFETGRYLEHCRVTGAGVAFSGAGFTARLCEVYNNGDDSARLGRSHAEPTVFEMCRFRDFKPAAGAHADGVQMVTYPAADVVVWGCSITMNTAAGYVIPPNTGYTGAIFVDTADVPIPQGDPEPTRRGGIWIDSCRLYSSNNYTLVVDGPNTDVRNCTLQPGTTAIESIQAGMVVTGGNNFDVNGVPIVDTDIHSDPRPRFLVDGDPRVVDGFPAATSGQTLVWNGTAWVAGTPGGGFTPVIRPTYITSGDIAFPNTAGAFQPVQQINSLGRIEVDIPASVGHWVEIDVTGLRTTGPAALMDVGVMVGSIVVRYLSSGGASPAGDGDVGWYADPSNFTPRAGAKGFTVTSGDLDTGNVRFVLLVNSNGTNTLKCSTGNPVYLLAKNLGPHN
jgi:hypothetical protein